MAKGTPLEGDHSAFNDVDFPEVHSQEERDDTPRIHNPWPAGNGELAVSDGDKWTARKLTWADLSDGEGKIQFGDVENGDYLEIDLTSGYLLLYGDATAFKDLLQSLVGQRLESPASDIVINPSEGSVTFQDDCTLSDYVTMNVQLNHDWLIGSDIYPHLHWWQTSANVPNWLIQYRWQKQDGLKTTSWTNVAYLENIFTYSSGTLNQITTFGAVEAPVGAGLSDIVQFRLLRDTDNDSLQFDDDDPLAGNADAVNFDIHYEVDSFGSDTEYGKFGDVEDSY